MHNSLFYVLMIVNYYSEVCLLSFLELASLCLCTTVLLYHTVYVYLEKIKRKKKMDVIEIGLKFDSTFAV